MMLENLSIQILDFWKYRQVWYYS